MQRARTAGSRRRDRDEKAAEWLAQVLSARQAIFSFFSTHTATQRHASQVPRETWLIFCGYRFTGSPTSCKAKGSCERQGLGIACHAWGARQVTIYLFFLLLQIARLFPNMRMDAFHIQKETPKQTVGLLARRHIPIV
jgi:hypothetical protein